MGYFNTADVKKEAQNNCDQLEAIKKAIEDKQAELKLIIGQEMPFKGSQIIDMLASSCSLIEKFNKNFESLFKETS